MSQHQEPEQLIRHPDVGVRVWNAHLEGDAVASISQETGLSKLRVRRILEASPPDLIEGDLRYRTGLRSVWITQDGEDVLRQESDGTEYPFVVLLHPHKITQASFRKGLRAAQDEIRKDGCPKFGFGYVSERVSLAVLLSMVHHRGYPAWEITADGGARRYDGRFEEMLAAPLPGDPSVHAKP